MFPSRSTVDRVGSRQQQQQQRPCPPLPLPFNQLFFSSTHKSMTNKNASSSSLQAVPLLDVLSCYHKHQVHYWDDSSARLTLLSLLSTVIFALGILAATLLYTGRCRQKRLSLLKKKQRPKRSVSFISSMMAAKVVPKQVQLPDPVINVIILFEQCPTVQDILESVIPKMLEYERLQCIPVLGKDEHLSFQPGSYSPSQLVRQLTVLPPQKDDNNNNNNNNKNKDPDSALYKLIQEHIHDPLDDPKSRGYLPWWEIVVIENKGPGHSACMWRIHHALGDGISIATVAQHILQFADGSPMTSVIPKGMMDKKQQQNSNKQRLPWYTLAWKLWRANWQVWTMATVTPDHPTVFSFKTNTPTKEQQQQQRSPSDNIMAHTQRRQPILFPTLPLDFVKAIKNAAQVTVNDVLFTCLSQAIHDYLQEQKCPVLREQQQDLLCRALIPAVLPRTVTNVATETLRNQWFMLPCDLGVGYSPDILERLHYLHQHLLSLKTSPVPLVGLALQNTFMPFAPRSWNEWITYNIFVRRSLSISNVPGPTKTCLFANQPACGVHMFLSNVIPHVAFISYANQIFGNITLDPEVIPDPESLSRHFGQAVVELATRLNIKDIPEGLC